MQLLECPIDGVRNKKLKCTQIRMINGRFVCGQTPFPYRMSIPDNYINGSILFWLKDCEYREEVKAK